MQTEMSRGPLAEDEHSRKGEWWGGGRPAFGRPTGPPPFSISPPFSFSAVVILCLSLAFLSAFHTEIHGKSLLLFYLARLLLPEGRPPPHHSFSAVLILCQGSP